MKSETEDELFFSMPLRFDDEVVLARQRARQVAATCGFDSQDQTRIATALSEIARNAFRYARGGTVEFILQTCPRSALVFAVKDLGPGIEDLASIMHGSYRSSTGMGIGILGAKRLMDVFSIDSNYDQGTQVRLGKWLPPKAQLPTGALLNASLEHALANSPLGLARGQNDELQRALATLQQREVALGNLNRELEATTRSVLELNEELDRRAASLEETNRELTETNRGIIALYAELDEKASSLQRANETKSRFLSHISHEFRTPLNSILSLSSLLIEQTRFSLAPEYVKQMAFIRRSAEELVEMVNDLLDSAKLEAGKIEVKPSPFEVVDLFLSLRGMFKPLVGPVGSVDLIIEEPQDIKTLYTDMTKLAQVLRNFISNALKFTHKGEVRVTARADGDDRVAFFVADTGIGIDAEDMERIFEDFTQINGPAQELVKGTGLGLSLSRQLARLLGGEVSAASTVGVGSTFIVVLPRMFVAKELDLKQALPLGRARLLELATASDKSSRERKIEAASQKAARRALVVDDQEVARYLMTDLLTDSGFTVTEAHDGHEALAWVKSCTFDLLVLDLVMPGMNGFEVLNELRSLGLSKKIEVIVNTAKSLNESELANLTGLNAGVLAKGESDRSIALKNLRFALDNLGL